jgi:hypothetical protein
MAWCLADTLDLNTYGISGTGTFNIAGVSWIGTIPAVNVEGGGGGGGTIITGAATTITGVNLTPSVALISNADGKVAVSTVTTGELSYLGGATSSIQTQLNSKQGTIVGAATSITGSDLTVNRVVLSNTDGKIAVSPITSGELDYLDNVTSNIQTQLNNKQNTLVGAVTTITGVDLTADRVILSNSAGKIAVSPITSGVLSYLTNVTSDIQTQLNAKQNTITGAITSVTGVNLTADRVLLSNSLGKVDVSPVTSGQLSSVTNRYFSSTIYKSVPWSGDAIPFWQAPTTSTITLTQVDAAILGTGTSTLTFNIEERTWTQLNAVGTDIWASDQIIATGGSTIVSFSNAGIANKAHLVLVPSGSTPEVGQVDAVTLLVSYTQI